MSKLKTRLVDRRRIQNRGLCHLHVLIYRKGVVTTLRQIKPLNSKILDTKPVVIITNHECVIRVDGVIKTRAQEKITSRHEERLSEVRRVQIVIENGRPYEFVVVRFDASEVEKKRSLLLHDWTTEIHVVLTDLKRRA